MLLNHMIRLECDECARILPSEQALHDHQNTVHSNIKQLNKHYRLISFHLIDKILFVYQKVLIRTFHTSFLTTQ